ncbi:MAG: hypothetical protein K1Y36_07625 [Blastocatellia bacterium]|nr:hypothetical protein [Blastocatellia bacterium]
MSLSTTGANRSRFKRKHEGFPVRFRKYIAGTARSRDKLNRLKFDM